jgi:hypothetical protein
MKKKNKSVMGKGTTPAAALDDLTANAKGRSLDASSLEYACRITVSEIEVTSPYHKSHEEALRCAYDNYAQPTDPRTEAALSVDKLVQGEAVTYFARQNVLKGKATEPAPKGHGAAPSGYRRVKVTDLF